MFRFDSLLGDDYYAYRRSDPNNVDRRLEELPIGLSLFADIAYVPWVLRRRDRFRLALPARVASWLEELTERPSVAREVEVVGAMS